MMETAVSSVERHRLGHNVGEGCQEGAPPTLRPAYAFQVLLDRGRLWASRFRG